MNLQHRLDLLIRLGEYISGNEPAWTEAKNRAGIENSWFTGDFINLAVSAIAKKYLSPDTLNDWTDSYNLASVQQPKKIGVVMAGNIPLVGFHDFMSVFISGHIAVMKASSRDEVLIKHIVDKLIDWDHDAARFCLFQGMLKGCDAYIATGSNNSSRYFEYYFGKYPNIIRKNRTSVGVVTGNESLVELQALADDVHLYFGLGCRNVTKIFVPSGYDFVPMLEAFRDYAHLADHHKYKNNYDYNLALHLLNKQYYMTNGSILLIENKNLFSPISQLNYEFYEGEFSKETLAGAMEDIQCIVGQNFQPLGSSQSPAVSDYADGIDTLQFLTRL